MKGLTIAEGIERFSQMLDSYNKELSELEKQKAEKEAKGEGVGGIQGRINDKQVTINLVKSRIEELQAITIQGSVDAKEFKDAVKIVARGACQQTKNNVPLTFCLGMKTIDNQKILLKSYNYDSSGYLQIAATIAADVSVSGEVVCKAKDLSNVVTKIIKGDGNIDFEDGKNFLKIYSGESTYSLYKVGEPFSEIGNEPITNFDFEFEVNPVKFQNALNNLLPYINNKAFQSVARQHISFIYDGQISMLAGDGNVLNAFTMSAKVNQVPTYFDDSGNPCDTTKFLLPANVAKILKSALPTKEEGEIGKLIIKGNKNYTVIQYLNVEYTFRNFNVVPIGFDINPANYQYVSTVNTYDLYSALDRINLIAKYNKNKWAGFTADEEGSAVLAYTEGVGRAFEHINSVVNEKFGFAFRIKDWLGFLGKKLTRSEVMIYFNGERYILISTDDDSNKIIGNVVRANTFVGIGYDDLKGLETAKNPVIYWKEFELKANTLYYEEFVDYWIVSEFANDAATQGEIDIANANAKKKKGENKMKTQEENFETVKPTAEIDFAQLADFVMLWLPAIVEGYLNEFIAELTTRYILTTDLIEIIYNFVQDYLQPAEQEGDASTAPPSTNDSTNNSADVIVNPAEGENITAPIAPVTSIEEAVSTLLNAFKTQDFPMKAARTMIQKAEGVDIPCYKWSLANLALMTLQGTNDARGFNQWKKVGRHVKPGSKAIYIFAPKMKKIKVTDKKTGEDKDTMVMTGFIRTPVFKIEDTEGAEVATAPDYTPKELPPFFNVAEKFGLKVEYMPCIGNYYGFYRSADKLIQLNTHDAGTYFHELAHAVHDTFEPLAGLPEAKKEIVAEFSAAILCEICGIKARAFQSYEYLEYYCKAATPNGVIKKVMGLLSTIEKVVSTILTAANEK